MRKKVKKAKFAAKVAKKSQKNHEVRKPRVLMALSGGIDSAVSAWKLIQGGYEVEAAFMKNYSGSRGLKFDECPWLQDRQDALRVAAFLGIPMHTINFEKEYEQHVLKYFFNEYKAGRTPNPDVMCNKEIKFKLLYNWAMKNNFDFVATGHYAQIGITDAGITKNDTKSNMKIVTVDNFKNEKMVGKWSNRKTALGSKTGSDTSTTHHLMRSKDDFKDQTYFIYNIRTPQLPHLLFPIGSMKKSEVRVLARKIGLPNAEKRESMGLCFVGKIRLKEFLAQKLKLKSGAIIDAHTGKKIGEHQGLSNYTIGQRQGLRVGEGGPWFVVRKDLKKNQLIVTNNPHDKLLEVTELEIHSVNWVSKPGKLQKGKTIQLKARYRHQGQLENITVSPVSRGHYKVKFAKPQLAVASGQSLVMYDGKVCVGGGVIV